MLYKNIKPQLRFDEVIKNYGYPLISKEVADAIERTRRNPNNYFAQKFNDESDYIKKYGHLWSLSKWKYILDSKILVSKKCCDILKINPVRKFEKETGLKPMTASMACESRLRKMSWLKTGCNSFNGTRPMSNPMSFWTEQDVLSYLKNTEIPYSPIYGEIVEEWTNYKRKKNKPTGKLILTGEKRTGCMFCAFGCHSEQEPNKFQRMKITHPKQYDYCIRPVSDGGLGLGEVLDFIDVKY